MGDLTECYTESANCGQSECYTESGNCGQSNGSVNCGQSEPAIYECVAVCVVCSVHSPFIISVTSHLWIVPCSSIECSSVANCNGCQL